MKDTPMGERLKRRGTRGEDKLKKRNPHASCPQIDFTLLVN